MIENKDFSVKKIILHANMPKMPDFCFYERCFFQLELQKKVAMDQGGQDEEIKFSAPDFAKEINIDGDQSSL